MYKFGDIVRTKSCWYVKRRRKEAYGIVICNCELSKMIKVDLCDRVYWLNLDDIELVDLGE